MFCSQCGGSISEHHKFCPACGAPVEGSGVTPVSMPVTTTPVSAPAMATPMVMLNNAEMKQNELKTLDELIKYFSVKQPQYDEYDSVSDLIYRLSRGSSKAAMVWGIIVMAAGLVFFVSGLSDPELLGLCIMALFFFIGGGCLLGLFFKLKKRNRDRLVSATDRYYELSDELYDYYCRHPNCPVGPEYTNPSNLMVVKSTIVSGRADTIKEALNLLVEDAHREKMENLAAQTAQYAQQAAQYAQQTAANTDSIRRSSSVAAVFTAANFFRRR